MQPRFVVALAALFAAVAASSVYESYAGQSCGTPHTKCRPHLLCEHKVCKIKPHSTCIGRETLCSKNYICAGKGADKRCVRPVGKGGNCNFHGARCNSGLVCAGNKHKKICVWPVGPGGWCAGSFAPCRSGLFCQNKVCKTPVNGDCKPKHSVCAHGTVCAGDHHKRRCVYPVREGGQCGVYPLQVCASGLTCSNYRCVSPTIGEGGDCTKRPTKCASGLTCMGLTYQKKCVAPSGVSGPCGTPFAVCETGLSCNTKTNKCRQVLTGLGSRCNADRPCSSGLTCRTGSTGGNRKTCVLLRNAGESCGFEFLCKGRLRCKGGFCDY